MFNKRTFLIAALIFLILGAVALLKDIGDHDFYSHLIASQEKTLDIDKVEMMVGQNKILVEEADTAEKRNRGLSGRDSLAENEGMLFIFDKPGFYTFWMKEMKFALDFIWIYDGKIVQITEDVAVPQGSALDYEILRPAKEVDNVLEVNSGWAKRHDVKINDEIKELD